MTCVQAPGSSANLGPGFDVLGVAVDRHTWLGDAADECPGPVERCGPGHISLLAYEAAGGSHTDLWFGFDLEAGRGLGFSASARAAGVVLAGLHQGLDIESACHRAYPLVAQMEGHGDNAAPSVFGGLHVVAGDLTHRLRVGLPGRLLCWIPALQTPTEESRAELPEMVRREDAVFNLGRVGLLIAALYEGDLSLLRRATEDRLHQNLRLSQCSPSRLALEAALDAGAAAAWLSGSGPTVAIVVDDDSAAAVIEGLPADGKVIDVGQDVAGAVVCS